MSSPLNRSSYDPTQIPASQRDAINRFGGNVPDSQAYDKQSQGLLIRYQMLSIQTRSAAGSLPAAVKIAVAQYLSEIGRRADPAPTLPAILGEPKFNEHFYADGSVGRERVPVKADAYMLQVLATRTNYAQELQALAGQPADAIVQQAFATCIPPQQPKSCDNDDVADRKADLTALLEADKTAYGASLTAQEVIQRAVAEGDADGALSLYCLTGKSMSIVRLRLGLDDLKLQTVAFEAQMAKIRADAFPGSLPAGDVNSPLAPAGAAFLQLQLDANTRINNVATAAAEYFAYQITYTRSLMIGA